jgi:hypothetical protein
VRRTKASLHDALIGLAREKPYPSIAVKEILDRANVGRSTFYTRSSLKTRWRVVHAALQFRGDPCRSPRSHAQRPGDRTFAPANSANQCCTIVTAVSDATLADRFTRKRDPSGET